MSDEFYPLTQALVRNLLDKIYEKRKSAAIDIEKLIKIYQSQEKEEEIRLIIRHCGENFCVSSNPHYRKGGTIGLAAVAIALGKQADKYCAEIIIPSVRLLQDPDSRVRYYACESLYNCVKVLETNVMPYFQQLFDALAKGYEDPDKDVRSAIIQLDRSLRETVTDAEVLDIAKIIMYLRDKIYPKSTQIRLFLINWITSLDRINGVNLVMYLPEILDGLLLMLDDSDETLVNKLKTLLDHFLQKILETDVDQSYRKIVNILVFQISNPRIGEIVRSTALLWLEKFIETFKEKILPFTSGILKAILPSFDDDIKNETTRQHALTVSCLLIDLLKNTNKDIWISKETAPDNKSIRLLPTQDPVVPSFEITPLPGLSATAPDNPYELNKQINEGLQPIQPHGIDLKDTIYTLCEFSGQYSKQTKLAALDWLHTLIDIAPNETMEFVEVVFPSIFRYAVDPSSNVISHGLHLVAKFSIRDVMKFVDATKSDFLQIPDELKPALKVIDNQYFLRFIYDLIVFLDTDLKMLEEKGDLIFGELSFHLGAELVFNSISEIITLSTKLMSKFQLVHKFNRILLSNTALYRFRMKLKSINDDNFCTIYKRLYLAWCYNKVALISLCLLTQNYDHSRRLIKTFGEFEIDVDTMCELDLLIQFLESPVFAFLRMHLMDPRYLPLLSETLYGVLMLLPQSDAFRILQNRLNSVPKFSESKDLIQYDMISAPDHKLLKKHINFDQLLIHLEKVQQNELQLKNERKFSNQLMTIDLNSNNVGSHTDRLHHTKFVDKHLSL